MEYCDILMESLNNLAIIYSERDESIESKKYLDQCEQLYKEYKNNDNNNNKNDKIEKQYTLALYYFAQVYLMLKNKEKSCYYTHCTLQRQLLNRNDVNFNDKEWIENALQLTIYYIENKRYKQAIHCIEAASKLKLKIKNDLELDAEMNKYWGNLYFCLLRDSYNVMNNHISTESTPKNDNKNTFDLIKLDEELKLNNTLILFHGIKLNEPPDMLLSSTYNESKELFKNALKYYTNCLKYYILDGFVTINVEINQNISLLYKYLSYFEKNLSIKCKLFKRRLNILIDIEDQLSIKVYRNIILNLCFEIASIYYQMAQWKKKIMQNNGKNDKEKVSKINMLFNKTLGYFGKFVTILEENANQNTNKKNNKKSVDNVKISSDYQFDYLEAQFLMASIYNKIIPVNKQNHIYNVQQTLNGYEYICEYYKKIWSY